MALANVEMSKTHSGYIYSSMLAHIKHCYDAYVSYIGSIFELPAGKYDMIIQYAAICKTDFSKVVAKESDTNITTNTSKISNISPGFY